MFQRGREGGSGSSYLNRNLLQFRVTPNLGIVFCVVIFLVFCCCLEVDVTEVVIFCFWEKNASKDYWSFSLMGFWQCFQGQRNNLLLISTPRPCQCDLMFISSQKLHWFSALIFFHLYLTRIQKCVNDTWIVPPVLTYWKFSPHWLGICFQAHALTQHVR